MTLTYKSTGGENYPVQTDEVWKVGEHQIRCGDLMEAKTIDWLDGFKPKLIYCDPPWGQALASGFRRKAGLTNYVAHEDLFAQVFSWIDTLRPKMPVYFEEGRRWVREMHSSGEKVGLKVRQRWDITYDRKVPATLTLFNAGHAKAPDFTGVDDTKTPAMAIEAHTKLLDIVMDPMVGRGQTAISADTAGRTFVGTELSPHRVSVTLTKLARLTGKEPIRG